MVTGKPAAEPAPARRTDFDLLRALACAAVIVGHALLVFSAEPIYHVKSRVPWAPATVACEALRIATMPVFFVLAGWAAVTSLAKRTAGRFMRDRVLRLLVPLAAGVLLQGPVIKYFELSQGRNLGNRFARKVTPLEGSLFEFLPTYFSRPKLWTWSHLWFLAYLFTISLFLLPILLRFVRRVPSAWVPGRLAVLWPALALGGFLALTRGYWPYFPTFRGDYANLGYFAILFLMGGALAAWPGIETRLRREAPWFLLLAAAGFAGVLALGQTPWGRVCVGLCAWGSVGALLGFVGRRPPAPSPTLDRVREATMPIYVLHHLPVLAIAVWVLPLSWHPGLKILTIVAGACAVSLPAYLWLVKPWPWLRPLFGMGRERPRGRGPREVGPEREACA